MLSVLTLAKVHLKKCFVVFLMVILTHSELTLDMLNRSRNKLHLIALIFGYTMSLL